VPIARPEYGPSLRELTGPRVRALPRPVRLALFALPVLVVVLLVAVALLRSTPLTQAVVRGPLTFNTRYDDRVERVPAGPGELLHPKAGPGRGEEDLVFRDAGAAPPRPEPAGGPVSQLALRMPTVMRPLQEGLEGKGFQVRSQGRVKIGRDYAGWLTRYQFRKRNPAGEMATYYGVRVLLLPDARGTKERVLDMSLQSEKSRVVANISDAGGNGPMRTPFYGVAFGTEKP
jgi:hypothetical protein